MRRLIASTFTSLDGVMQAPGGPTEDPTGNFTLGGWLFAFGDDAGMDLSAAGFDGKDRELALGRKTYEIFEAYWPYQSEDDPIARTLNAAFPDSSVGAVHRAPGDFPSGKKGDVLTVEFTVMGIPCLGLNGGPAFKHNEAFSFQVATADQAETDRYWNAIVGNGGEESACGWCKDKWGLSWQITPIALTKAVTGPDPVLPGRMVDDIKNVITLVPQRSSFFSPDFLLDDSQGVRSLRSTAEHVVQVYNVILAKVSVNLCCIRAVENPCTYTRFRSIHSCKIL